MSRWQRLYQLEQRKKPPPGMVVVSPEEQESVAAALVRLGHTPAVWEGNVIIVVRYVDAPRPDLPGAGPTPLSPKGSEHGTQESSRPWSRTQQ